MPQSGVSRAGSPVVASPAPHSQFFRYVHQSIHDFFIRLETRLDHVYNCCEEDAEQEGREQAPSTKALFHSEPPRAHPVVKPHTCSFATMELTNDRDNYFWHAKMGYYCPEEDSVNGVVRLGRVDEAYIQRNSFLPRQLL